MKVHYYLNEIPIKVFNNIPFNFCLLGVIFSYYHLIAIKDH